MIRHGPRWVCEVTDVKTRDDGRKNYKFYILDKNSGHEYEGRALVDKEQNAEWEIEKVADNR